VRVHRAFREAVAGVDVVALLDVEVLALRDQIFRDSPSRDDQHLLHASAHAAELHAPSISDTVAASFGFRASNSSDTRADRP